VNPKLYGDGATRFFAYWTVSIYIRLSLMKYEGENQTLVKFWSVDLVAMWCRGIHTGQPVASILLVQDLCKLGK